MAKKAQSNKVDEAVKQLVKAVSDDPDRETMEMILLLGCLCFKAIDANTTASNGTGIKKELDKVTNAQNAQDMESALDGLMKVLPFSQKFRDNIDGTMILKYAFGFQGIRSRKFKKNSDYPSGSCLAVAQALFGLATAMK